MSYYDSIIEMKGLLPGPTSLILAGVHGDEVCGVETFRKILSTLRIEAGTVICMFGNPRAIEARTRFVETNLNRLFMPDTVLKEEQKLSYEYTRAQLIKSYLERADVLLDIHASFTPKSRAFVICEPVAYTIVETLPVDTVVSGFDAVEPGGTDYYMNTLGKIGICLECGYIGDKKSYEVAENGLNAFLQTRGHVRTEVRTTRIEQTYITVQTLYYAKSSVFRLTKRFADFETVPQGTAIGIDGTSIVKAPYDGVILFAQDTNKVGEEAFLFGRTR